MARFSLKVYCQSKGFNRVSDVRSNVKGYKYVTLGCKETGETENLYLGVRYSEEVEVGERLDLTILWVAETLNNEGEPRMKLTNKAGEMSEEKLAEYQTI